MTSIDERLARDVAAVTGGVIVTESDLREARDAVDDRLERQFPRPLLRAAGAAAAAAVVLAAVGGTVLLAQDGEDSASQVAGSGTVLPAPDAAFLVGTPPTEQQLDGVWRLDNGTIVLRFEGDGTVTFDDQGRLFSAPGTTASYAIAGGLITVTTTDDDRAECIGRAFTMRASLPEPGALRFVTDTVDACTPLPVGRQVLEQALPTGESLLGLAFSGESGWRPVTDQDPLRGVFLAEGGGHVLELDVDGAYSVADDSGDPVDGGRWVLRGRELVLTSSAASTTCSEGAQLRLGPVEWLDSGTRAFRGTVAQNACGGAWTPPSWFLLPNAND